MSPPEPLRVARYSFGRLEVAGRLHRSDLWIANGAVHENWRRRRGHELHPADLEGILAAGPRLLVVGRGALGRMRILPETEALLAARGVELLAAATPAAVKTWNEHAGEDGAVAAFHLTC